jgi:carnosine N-methyltransferase
VLVPGSGLARFAVDLAQLGYDVEANEISTAHVLAVAWVLEQRANTQIGNWKLHPWVTQFSNHVEAGRQFDSVNIPYQKPAPGRYPLPRPELVLANGNLVLEAGETFRITTSDFVQAYGPPPSSPGRQDQSMTPSSPTESSITISSASSTASLELPPSVAPSLASSRTPSFDAVATIFFLDTAQNVLSYICTVHHALRPGGLWLNSGPLLWHAWENGPSSRGEGDRDWDEIAKARGVRSPLCGIEEPDVEKPGVLSLELSWSELLLLLSQNGFRVLEARYGNGCQGAANTTTTTGFVSDVKSMGVYGYKIGFFKAQKVSDVNSD